MSLPRFSLYCFSQWLKSTWKGFPQLKGHSNHLCHHVDSASCSDVPSGDHIFQTGLCLLWTVSQIFLYSLQLTTLIWLANHHTFNRLYQILYIFGLSGVVLVTFGILQCFRLWILYYNSNIMHYYSYFLWWQNYVIIIMTCDNSVLINAIHAHFCAWVHES